MPISHSNPNAESTNTAENDYLLRYSRHILLKEIDLQGQQLIETAKVLIIGCGGLGSTAAPILAAAGLKKLGLIDFDHIELSNLQRQTSYFMHDLGQNKATTLKTYCLSINPLVEIEDYPYVINMENLPNLIAEYDFILDCTDNFTSRQLINRCCVKQQKTLISGAAVRFEGQISVYPFKNLQTPCYACLFPDGDADDGACSLFGVFSPLVHIIGAMQAQETLKCIMNIGKTLTGYLLTYDALNAEWQGFKFKKNPHCSICANR